MLFLRHISVRKFQLPLYNFIHIPLQQLSLSLKAFLLFLASILLTFFLLYTCGLEYFCHLRFSPFTFQIIPPSFAYFQYLRTNSLKLALIELRYLF